MEAYKPYVDYILAGGVAETAYILSKQGVLCGTNLPIKEMPIYNFEIEDEKDPNIKHQIVVDEKANLLEALSGNGVSKHQAGIRLYNQKYYTAHFDNDPSSIKTLYLKKVNYNWFRKKEEPVFVRPRTSSLLEHSILTSKCKMVSLKTLENLTRELRPWPRTSSARTLDWFVDLRTLSYISF